MEQWLPRQPLILTPTIPLMWTVGWLCTMSAYIILGGEPPSPNQLQDSALLVSAVILVMNMYNLILIYQRAEKYRNLSPYYFNCSCLGTAESSLSSESFECLGSNIYNFEFHPGTFR